jgi:hypothetical protein
MSSGLFIIIIIIIIIINVMIKNLPQTRQHTEWALQGSASHTATMFSELCQGNSYFRDKPCSDARDHFARHPVAGFSVHTATI